MVKSELTLAIVVPCFNEEEGLRHTFLTLSDLLKSLESSKLISCKSYILFVDDGSSDNAWALIEDLFAQNRLLKGLKLSRNFGHQAALLAGLDFVTNKCDIAISIDADLQQDPSVIKDFIKEYIKGSDIVLGVRKDREADAWIKKKTATYFYAMMKMMGVDIVPNHADYRLLSNKALQVLGRFKESNIFLRATCLQLGFKVGTVHFDVTCREFGETKYTIRKMLRLALDGITAFSVVPLRIIAILGFVVFFLSLAMGCYVLYQALIVGGTVPGWASITLPIYFLGGIQLLCLGVIGEYVGQIYKNSKDRPRWICERVLA